MKTSIENRSRKPRENPVVKVIVERDFIGGKALTDAFIPVITEDLKKRAEQSRTFDSADDSS